jgi:AcrR family transcriptional regulator
MVAARSPDNDVRAATIAAATRLFAAQGFEGTALQQIADAVGVSKPAILHHFPSKEHVRQAVFDTILSHWNERLPRLLLAATAGDDRFDAVLGELHRFFSDNPDRARLIAREVLDRPAEFRKVLRGSVQPWLGAVAGYVRSGKERGLHYTDVDEEAYVLHILLFVITATATATVMSSALENDARPRYDRELSRIARASLFPPVTSSQRVSSVPPNETDDRPARADTDRAGTSVTSARRRKASR